MFCTISGCERIDPFYTIGSLVNHLKLQHDILDKEIQRRIAKIKMENKIMFEINDVVFPSISLITSEDDIKLPFEYENMETIWGTEILLILWDIETIGSTILQIAAREWTTGREFFNRISYEQEIISLNTEGKVIVSLVHKRF